MSMNMPSKGQAYTHFAVIVDGEVASHIGFPPEDERNIAAYRSNPIFIEVPYEQRPVLGSTWDGEKFILPEGFA